MNDYVLSVVLGIVEGATEFLPVSSTAHLRIAESLLHIDLANDYWKMYSVVIQLGAVLCLPFYFRSRFRDFAARAAAGRSLADWAANPAGRSLLAFVVTAVPAFLLSKIIGKNLESLRIIGVSLLLGGIAMWAIDRWHTAAERRSTAAGGGPITTWRVEDMSALQAIWIGACQILSAVFPGTSRSMSTIAAGQLAGMSRAAALEFSFFLAVPTMGAATVYDFLKALKTGGLHADPHGLIVLAIGFVTSFVVAYLSVAWFMAQVRRHGLIPFAVYRILLGLAVLGMAGASLAG